MSGCGAECDAVGLNREDSQAIQLFRLIEISGWSGLGQMRGCTLNLRPRTECEVTGLNVIYQVGCRLKQAS